MKEKGKFNQYFYQGLTLFCAIAACIILYFLILRLNIFIDFIVKIFKVLAPIFIGLLFAYLLNPIVTFFEKFIDKNVIPTLYKNRKANKRMSRVLGIFITYFLVGFIIFLFIQFVIPSFFESLEVMLSNVPVYLNKVYEYLRNIFKNNPDLSIPIETWNTNITDYVTNIVVPSMDTVMNNITTGITGVVRGIINVLIGLIVSVYLIFDKELFLKGTDRVLKVTLPKKVYDTSMTTLSYLDKIFGGFMMAKIIDSLIIGILTFIVASIFQIPYAIIIALIVGITNIIPYFGPFIGAIICGILLILIDPAKCLTFVIIIFLIQQFDGNILGPKLIGNKTGIKSFWVLFSILLFGGLFGFVGMIFGVPVFAVIYSVVNTMINKKLELRKNE